jgi:hypothetical protein
VACAGYNSLSLNHEQIGAAAQQTWPEAQLRNTAEWVAYWSKLHRIPIQRGRVGNGQVIKPGVVMHSELGAIGGGHHDPGVLYPIDRSSPTPWSCPRTCASRRSGRRT